MGSAGLRLPDVVCFLKQDLALAPWDWVGQECRGPCEVGPWGAGSGAAGVGLGEGL